MHYKLELSKCHVICILFLISSNWIRITHPSVVSKSVDNENYVILDGDPGADDAWALMMLIKAEETFKAFKLLAVTCVRGNAAVDSVAKNAARVLNIAGKKDIPVFKGADGPILPQNVNPSYFYGKDGFGDVYSSEDVNGESIQKEHAVNALYEFATKYPKKISFILIGPLTNFALCLKMYPDFATKIKDVYIMGGNIRGVGNSSPAAEFNFHLDPEAAFIVLNSHNKYKITILPWETCLATSSNIPIKWIFDTLNTSSNAFVNFMTPIEKACYFGQNNWTPCDALLVAAFLSPKQLIKASSEWHANVEINGALTKGQMVLDHLKTNVENVVIVERIDENLFKNIILWIANDRVKLDLSK